MSRRYTSFAGVAARRPKTTRLAGKVTSACRFSAPSIVVFTEPCEKTRCVARSAVRSTWSPRGATCRESAPLAGPTSIGTWSAGRPVASSRCGRAAGADSRWRGSPAPRRRASRAAGEGSWVQGTLFGSAGLLPAASSSPSAKPSPSRSMPRRHPEPGGTQVNVNDGVITPTSARSARVGQRRRAAAVLDERALRQHEPAFAAADRAPDDEVAIARRGPRLEEGDARGRRRRVAGRQRRPAGRRWGTCCCRTRGRTTRAHWRSCEPLREMPLDEVERIRGAVEERNPRRIRARGVRRCSG